MFLINLVIKIMHDLKKLKEIDIINRVAEKESAEEFSPMNPPNAYSPPVLDTVNYEDYHPLIQKFLDEHKECLRELDDFENLLNSFQKNGLTNNKKFNDGLRVFFTFFDNNISLHNRKEEKTLFPLLQVKLLANGEHGNGEFPKTAVDMMEDDHIKLMQLASITFNFFGLSSRLPDIKSRGIALDASIEQGKAMVELLRLHIFREDNVVFPLSHKYIENAEFELIIKYLTRYEYNINF